MELIEKLMNARGTAYFNTNAARLTILEDELLLKGFKCEEHYSYGTSNWFYSKEGEEVVFVTYYSDYSGIASFATMNKNVYDEYFAGTHKKIAFTPRYDGNLKAIVSMNGRYVALSHLAFDDIPEGYCVDHIYHDIRFNDSVSLRLVTNEQNNRNRRNSKKFVGDGFDYNPAMDFRDNWWLVLCVTMLHEITWKEAITLNKEVRQ